MKEQLPFVSGEISPTWGLFHGQATQQELSMERDLRVVYGRSYIFYCFHLFVSGGKRMGWARLGSGRAYA